MTKSIHALMLVSVATLTGAVTFVATPLVAQSPAAARDAGATAVYVPPRTPWGDPDLQGIWPGSTGVPMQRPADLGERAELTVEEFARREAEAAAQAKADLEPYGKGGGRGGRGGGIGPPDHWLERGRPSRQTSLIVDPPNGRLPALTPAAEKLRKEGRNGRPVTGEWRGVANTWEDLNIYYRCITRGVLGSVIPVIYGNTNEIVQAPGYVVFRNEMIHESRVVPLDGRPPVSDRIRMYMGDSRGRWDGDMLVVVTTNMTDKVPIGSNGAGYAGDPGHHTEALRLVERFTRTSDDVLEYRATVEDLQTWTRPWTLLIRLQRDATTHLHEYACHEGNYAMENILRGARADERAPSR
jgi:hypothetical protein